MSSNHRGNHRGGKSGNNPGKNRYVFKITPENGTPLNPTRMLRDLRLSGSYMGDHGFSSYFEVQTDMKLTEQCLLESLRRKMPGNYKVHRMVYGEQLPQLI